MPSEGLRRILVSYLHSLLSPAPYVVDGPGLLREVHAQNTTPTSLHPRRWLTSTGNHIHSNTNNVHHDDAIERAVRQQHDLRLIADRKYDRLLAEYMPVIQTVCAVRRLSPGETLEVTGIVMKRMWNELESGKDFTRVSVYGSVVTKARWEAGGALERRVASSTVELMEPAAIGELAEVATDDDYSYVMTDDYSDLYSAVDQLTETQRLVIELIYVDDLTVAEVAEYLGKKANAVSQIKFNALAKLALIMGA